MSACGAVYSHQGHLATLGVSLSPCDRPMGHIGCHAFEVRKVAPPPCPVCHHPEHDPNPCLVRFILGNVRDMPRMACTNCGPGAQARDQEDADAL